MTGQKLSYVLKLVSMLGYPGLFLGLIVEFLGIPFPGEIVLAFSGFMVWKGHLEFYPALLAAVAGSTTGSVISYALGRKFGRPFIEKYGRYAFLNDKKIDKVERWFNRHCFILLLFGRFISGVRPLSSYMAGISCMKFRVFFPLSFIGTLIWCTTFVLIGKSVGRNWTEFLSLFRNYSAALFGLVFLTLIIYSVWKFANKK